MSEGVFPCRRLRGMTRSSQGTSGPSRWQRWRRQVGRSSLSLLSLVTSKRVMRKEFWSSVWYRRDRSFFDLRRRLLHPRVRAGRFVVCGSRRALAMVGSNPGSLLAPWHIFNVRCICRHGQCCPFCAIALLHNSCYSSPPCRQSRFSAKLQHQLVEVGAGIAWVLNVSIDRASLARREGRG